MRYSRLFLAGPVLLCACSSSSASGGNYLHDSGASDVASDSTLDTGVMDTSVQDVQDTGVADTALRDGPMDAPADARRPDGGDGGPTVKKRVFVTSATYTGQFSPIAGINGLSDADTACGDRAFSAGLGGTWVAWLSAGATDAPQRITDVSPWYLVDQTTLVFPTAASLSSVNGPMHAIDQDETGFPVGIDSLVWTGTDSFGAGTLDTCNSWGSMATTDNGTVGDASQIVEWTETTTAETCDKMHHIYCFEQ